MTILPNRDQLPPSILNTARAVVWKHEIRDGRPTKVPYTPHRPSERAAVDNADTWNTFEVAYACVADGQADGAGVVLGHGLTGIDLDHCRDADTGTIAPWALAIVRELDSYCEVSPSGTGLHILVEGDLLPGGRRKDGIELYADLRYFTVTGNRMPGAPAAIHERTAALAAIHRRLFGADAHRPATPPVPAAAPITDDDAALIERAMHAANGSIFAALWSGDTSHYAGDDSAADLALANLLAFWTQCDAARMDRLFRQSGRVREKWDSKRRDSTYGRQTIEKAIATCTVVYEPAVEIEIDDAPVATATPVASSEGDDGDSLRVRRWPVLHPNAYVGLFGDLVAAVAPTTEADSVALLGHSLVLFGNLIGRTPRYGVGAVEHHLNENMLICGDTSTGRKGQAFAEARAIFDAVDPDWAASRIVTGLSSGEGLIYSVRDPLVSPSLKPGGGDVVDDPGVSDKRLLVGETEFAKTLRVARREGNTLSAVVRQA